MPKFTKQQKARILAEAEMHTAIRRADLARKKYLLLLQKEKMAECHRVLPISKGGNHGYGK